MVQSNTKNMKEPASEIRTSGYGFIVKTVVKMGNSGRVYVPKDWIGKEVQIILREPLEDKKEKEDEHKSI
jgi:hypothetical protein